MKKRGHQPRDSARGPSYGFSVSSQVFQLLFNSRLFEPGNPILNFFFLSFSFPFFSQSRSVALSLSLTLFIPPPPPSSHKSSTIFTHPSLSCLEPPRFSTSLFPSPSSSSPSSLYPKSRSRHWVADIPKLCNPHISLCVSPTRTHICCPPSLQQFQRVFSLALLLLLLFRLSPCSN